ncbi:MAG TPA: sulfocyanin-like copper-binding protein [bacterium]|nr:sulfocyanin-like copper-binding protein [bacterium]
MVAAGTTATFSIVAAQTPANGELNFNGADKGRLVITVPLGASVQITLTNKGSLPHSLEIIPYSDRLPAAAVPTPALPGAMTKDPQTGIMKGQTATMQFTAGKAGKYLLICGFPGHALLGMYGIFEVASSANVQPSLVIKK